MSGNSRSRWASVMVVALVAVLVGTAAAEVRTWRDTSGKFSVEAELVMIDGDHAVLRRSDNGKEVRVPLRRLSDDDREYLKANAYGEPAADDEPNDSTSSKEVNAERNEAILEVAERFFEDLRTKERDEALAIMTEAAQAVAKDGKGPLAALPTPDEHDNAIKPGKVKMQGSDKADVPVTVRVGGKSQKTTLHLRQENEAWRVYGLSATFPDGEKTIDFETAAPPAAAPNADPLVALVGQKLDLSGVLLDGRPLDMTQYKGKVVLIDFWATWCGPCRAEIPNILANYNQHHEAGFDVIAVSVDQDLEALAKFVAEEKPPWAVVADRHPQNATSMGSKFGISGIPAFILLDREGKVAAVHCRGPRLGQEVAKLLAAPGDPSAQAKN